eukprot:TRINITY_DN20555_c0_g1_i1.p1 TRINITY_DN20555_c0_g1~~TRINITY_DN20555_c0_g1_i1.p1  ORF type:complete len:575 (+),score=-23.48 TRINITY_DN20555_c0_g1_i1:68-1792(+)
MYFALRKTTKFVPKVGLYTNKFRQLSSTANSTITGAAANEFLSHLGINKLPTIHYNLSYDNIAEHEEKNKEGKWITTKYGDVYGIDTGKFTGRSPKDKYIVKRAGTESEKHVDWGKVNQPMTEEVFNELKNACISHYNNAEKAYVFDGFCGANPVSRKNVRIITELAWQHHFCSNMFIRAKVNDTINELANFAPDFTIINACNVSNPKFKEQGLNSEVFVAFDVEQKLAIIGGTFYGGEMKKGIFSMMNYWLPLSNIMAMHCSANLGKSGDTALFFGLSGTGKTTLSADPHRLLIGDDEHGWDDHGIFNFEGGCYAKTINLKEENEPEIYRAIKRDALLENVYTDDKDGKHIPDYDNKTKTENGRVSYPIFHIDSIVPDSMGGHPKNVIFLTCDAFGILPPVSLLTPEQAMYHFLSGYTAKVAGTERGVTKPVETFSACFGAAFLTLHPTKYADLLQKKLKEHSAHAFLVNTGWSGGGPGVGKRMSIKATRACIDSILDGSIHNVKMNKDPIFQFSIPESLNGVPANICNPRDSWEDKNAYDEQRIHLAHLFKNNYTKYQIPGVTDYSPHGPLV